MTTLRSSRAPPPLPPDFRWSSCDRKLGMQPNSSWTCEAADCVNSCLVAGEGMLCLVASPFEVICSVGRWLFQFPLANLCTSLSRKTKGANTINLHRLVEPQHVNQRHS